MLKTRSLLLLGVLCYLFFMVALFPISQTGKKFSVNNSNWFRIGSIDGSVLSAEVAYRLLLLPESVRSGRLEWSPSLWPLLRVQLGGLFELSHPGLKLSLIVSRGLKEVSVSQFSGLVQSRFLNQVTQDKGFQMTGDVEVDSLLVTINLDSRELMSAKGVLRYPGGKVSFKQNGRNRSVTLPALIGQLRAEGSALVLDIKVAESSKLLAMTKLQSDGWGQLVVYQSLLKLVGMAQGNVKEEEQYLDIKEKIFDIID